MSRASSTDAKSFFLQQQQNKNKKIKCATPFSSASLSAAATSTEKRQLKRSIRRVARNKQQPMTQMQGEEEETICL